MTVLNVLSTNSVAAGATEYQTVQTGYYRVGSTAGAATMMGMDAGSEIGGSMAETYAGCIDEENS